MSKAIDELQAIVNALTELVQEITVEMAKGEYKGKEAVGLALLSRLREGTAEHLALDGDEEQKALVAKMVEPMIASVVFLESALQQSMSQ